MLTLLSLALTLLASPGATLEDAPSILVVTAHPDDEAMFAATMWKAVREHGATVDLALVTDGAGGYRFSTLAEPIYGLNLTDPDVARTVLPKIRKQELMAGGDVVGIRNYFFLDQPDAGRILDVDSVFTELWDGDWVTTRLTEIMADGGYDMVLTFLPIPTTHAHHKGASILAVRAASALPEHERPVLVGSLIGSDSDDIEFRGLEGYPETVLSDDGPFTLDREQKLGLDGRLNYQIVVNWLITEHKSQGTMQTYLNAGRYERFWMYAANSPEQRARGAAMLTGFDLQTAGQTTH
ncbi:MAG: PIG-L family deacetylase [Rhodothermales bacterium]|nr:PIG-L family deacetylase [Rhodothermales bacterium]MBO6781519.1 PIG-L family deacetylase [Rhodothermales bacterium]